MSTGSTPVVRDSRLDVLEEHIRAENEHNINRIMTTFGLGAVLVINGQSIADRGQIRAAHDGLGFSEEGSFSDLNVREVERYVAENAIVVEQVLSGVHTGTWEGIEATGRAFEVPVCTVYKFAADQLILRETVYFDWRLLEKQLTAH